MGRIKPAYYYQRQLTIATARDAYRAANPPTPTAGTINSRGATTDAFYRCMTLSSGATPLIVGVKVRNDVIGMLTLAQLGLGAALGAGEVALRQRGSGIKPTKIHWYAGDTTPTRVTTPWGSKWNKYYADKTYSAPFSKATGAVTATDLRDAFDALFGGSGTERALLGTENGRAWLELEQAPIAYSN